MALSDQARGRIIVAIGLSAGQEVLDYLDGNTAHPGTFTAVIGTTGNFSGLMTTGSLSTGAVSCTTVDGTLASFTRITNTGPDITSIGASTSAAGSDSAGANALPARTASVYPTTAADDTAGVRVNAADNVTGTVLLIGNGVADKILKVYPPTGGTINGAAANAAFSSVSGKGVIMVCLSGAGNTWLAW